MLLGIPATFASPLPLEGGDNTEIGHIFERQSADRICGDKNFYSSSFQSETFMYGKSYDLTGTTITGSNGAIYPHVFRNDENINLPDCPGVPAPYQEFPILQGGLLFGGGDPGTDRVIYKITSTNPASGLPDNFAYCGLITHIGAPPN
ncbi:hypothetical protein PHISP_07286, partial [Aspergillus sp. HF37]